ncbi:MAG: amino acid ABC transporter permease [Ancalomicrobiaceae bacterium]|nr:amino acid ABC transporter permease [Ancalomicrobiaceae bacterium]
MSLNPTLDDALDAPVASASRDRPPRQWPAWWHGLFGTKLNAAITFGFLAVFWFVLIPFVNWALINATWIGTAATCAASDGACWAFIAEKLHYLVFGPFPIEAEGRAVAAFAVMIGLLGVSAFPRTWGVVLVLGWVASLAVVIWLLAGGGPLKPISTEHWGGFIVTLFLTLACLAGAFPVALLLVAGRRSEMGGIRFLSIAFIEVVRGVPLIAILYTSTLLVPLMLPSSMPIDKFARAAFGITLFSAAYLAEVLRSGLLAVPRGQFEAAHALGLTRVQAMRLVVLPQALRVALPSIINLAIGILLDTTLIVVIGIFELLNAARAAANDTDWLGRFDEAYAFTGIVFFVLSLGLSRWSHWLEMSIARRQSR